MKDFTKSFIFLFQVFSSAYPVKIPITPTPAGQKVANYHGSCGSYNNSMDTICNFPDLFSEENGTCQAFNKVDCGNRTVPLTPCEYTNSNCTRPRENATLCVCEKDLDLNYDMCLSLSDGIYAWPARHWSPYYIQCTSKRTLPSTCDGHSVIYNFFENKCQVVYEVVNAAYNLSLSLNIPESLYHLLSFRPTHYIPQTTIEISSTHFDSAYVSDMMSYSSQLVLESAMFTNPAIGNSPSAISNTESYNNLETSSIHATQTFDYLETSYITTHLDLSPFNSATTVELISSFTSSPDSELIYQQHSSKEIISSYPASNQHSKLATNTKSSKTSTNELESTQEAKSFISVFSTTMESSQGSIYFSSEYKQEKLKNTTRASSLSYPIVTTNGRENDTDSVHPFTVNMKKTSFRDLPQKLYSSTDNLQSSISSFHSPSSIISSSFSDLPQKLYSSTDNLQSSITSFHSSSSIISSSFSELLQKSYSSIDIESPISSFHSSSSMISSSFSDLQQKTYSSTDNLLSSPFSILNSSNSMISSSSNITSSSIFSAQDLGLGTTIFPVHSPLLSASSLGMLSDSSMYISNSFQTLKQTSFSTHLPIVKHTATLNTTNTSVSPYHKPIPVSSFKETQTIIPSMLQPSTSISTISRTIISSVENSDRHDISEYRAQTYHMTASLSPFSSNFVVSSSMHKTIENLYTVPASVMPFQNGSMQVSVELTNLSSSSNQLKPGPQSNNKYSIHEFGHSSSTRKRLHESYIFTESFKVSESSFRTLPSSKPDKSEYVVSLPTTTLATSFAETKLDSKLKMNMYSSGDMNNGGSRSSEVFKSDISLSDFIQPNQTLIDVTSQSLKPTSAFTSESTKLNNTSSSSRESVTKLESSIVSISRSKTIKDSFTITSDFVPSLTPFKLSSESLSSSHASVTLTSGDVNQKPTKLSTGVNKVILNPSKTVTDQLPKTFVSFESRSSNNMIKPSLTHGHSMTTTPHQVPRVTNKPNDNSAERQKNNRTSIAIGAGVGGGILLICIIIVVVIIILRKRNKRGARDFFQVRLPPELFMTRSL